MKKLAPIFCLLGLLFSGGHAHAALGGSCSPYLSGQTAQDLGITTGWTGGGTTFTTGATAPPISTCQPLAATSTDDTSTGFHYVQHEIFSGLFMPQGAYTYTAYAKRVAGTGNVQMQAYFLDGSSEVYANVDLGACSINSTSNNNVFYNQSATAVLVGGYCKISLNFLTNFPETAIVLQLANLNGSFQTSYTGNGTNQNAYWGVDFRTTPGYVNIGDGVNYYSGFYTGSTYTSSYTGFIFSSGGTERTPNQIAIVPATFPNAATMSWYLNPTFDCGGTCATLFELYGLYSGNFQVTPIPPKQVSGITTATGTSTLAFNGVLTGYDVIYDTFLTTTSGGSTFCCEVEVFLHINPTDIAYVGGLPVVGTTTISGIPMTVYRAAMNPQGVPDYLFMPTSQTDPPNSTTIDLKAMLAYLVAQGQLTGSEWFNGFGLLAEVWGDKGAVTVTSFVGVLN